MTGMDDGAKILVVEDDSTIRTILGMALDGAGFKSVSMAGRGDDGLDVARREKPDLVLLDLMLPGLDGFTVAKRIRETPELSGTRIIMLTARTQSDDIVRGLECGADDYVTKPFDRKVLLARVRAEFKLLVRLVAHRGRIFARPADERTVDVQVANLRRKLGRWGAHIETVRGVGYRVS